VAQNSKFPDQSDGGASVSPLLRLVEGTGSTRTPRPRRTAQYDQARGWRLIDCRPDLYDCLAAASRRRSAAKEAIRKLKRGLQIVSIKAGHRPADR
jgi:hypothetical protein